MTTEISIQTLGDAVKERVKKAIFDSIPDEAVESLIKRELERMTQDVKDRYGDVKKSELTLLIEKELKEQISIKTRDLVLKYIEETFENNSKEIVNAAIKEMAPLFMASMMEKFSAMAVQDLKFALQAKGVYL